MTKYTLILFTIIFLKLLLKHLFCMKIVDKSSFKMCKYLLQ